MNVPKVMLRATGIAVLWLGPLAALATPALRVWAGEDGSVGTDRQCDVYIAGEARGPGPDPLHFRWLDGHTPLAPWREVRADGTAPVELCGLSIGEHRLTLEVTDGARTASDTVIATILDTSPAAGAFTASGRAGPAAPAAEGARAASPAPGVSHASRPRSRLATIAFQ